MTDEILEMAANECEKRGSPFYANVVRSFKSKAASSVVCVPKSLIDNISAFCDSFADHADRCRVCRIHWQNIRSALSALNNDPTDSPS